MTSKQLAAVVLGAGLLFGGPALAQDFWTGPYLGPTLGQGDGQAVYRFNTDGQYNNNPGDVFAQPLYSTPIGGVIGYNWQRGGMLYGVESFFYSRGISAVNSCLMAWSSAPPGVCGSPNPFILPNDGDIDMKGHWFTGLTGRIGFAEGRVMAYLQGGVLIGHLVQELTDNTLGLEYWDYGTAAGVTVGAGFEVMITPRWSIGLGYRALRLLPLHSAGPSQDQVTNVPQPGPGTDHTLQYTVQEVLGRLVFHPGRRGPVDVAFRPPFDWPGFWMGWYAGALWQIGVQAGYDWSIGGPFIAGINAQASLNIYDGRSLEGDLNARIGFTTDNLLIYAEGGIATQTGDFFDILFGPFWTVGAGVEYAFNDRLSAFVEAKLVHGIQGGVTDGNFQAGLNWHLGNRH